VTTSLTDIENSIEIGSLTRRSEHATHSTFKRSDFRSHSIVRWVLQTSIEIALILEVEQTSHCLARLIFESSTLDDRKYATFPILWRPASLHAKRLKILFHVVSILLVFEIPLQS
jgi:hypothetical protein